MSPKKRTILIIEDDSRTAGSAVALLQENGYRATESGNGESRQQLEECRERLHKSEAQWERTFNSFTDIVTLQDTAFRILKINRTGCETLDQTCMDIVGRPCFELFHGSAEPCPDCPLLEAKEDFQSYTREIFHAPLGKTFLVSAAPILNEQGELEFIAHVAKDISLWKEAEKEKEHMQAKLLHAQKLESVGRLAAGIAHEINTPIQYIGTNVDFLKDGFRDISRLMGIAQGMIAVAETGAIPSEMIADAGKALEEADWEFLREEIPAALQQSGEGVQRVSSIVRAMKEFSHPGSKEKTMVNLNRIITTTITVARNEWKYVAEVETRLDPELPEVNCLRDEMGQVILNMLVNAAHAIGEKPRAGQAGGKGKITVETGCNMDWITLRISDTGTGIPETIKTRIFDPFFTTKEVGKGTGQGLAISHDVIVEKHGGTIEVDSSPGKGTSFLLRLPRT